MVLLLTDPSREDAFIPSNGDKTVNQIQHVDCLSDTHAVNAFLILSCMIVGAASFLFGFDDKIISPVAALTPLVSHYQGPNPTTHTLSFTARNQDLLFAVPLVGSILGALLASPLNSYFGRKWPLMGAYIVSIGGGLLQVFAPNMAALVSGRYLNGISIGIANTTAPLYLSEVVPARMRGRSVSVANILNLASGVVGTIVVYGTKGLGGRRTYMIPLAIQCALPVILFILTLPIPESPQWLIAQGRIDQAHHNLRKLRGFSDSQVDDELRLMSRCEDSRRRLTANVHFWDIFWRRNLKRTLTAGSLYSFNQISGIILSTTYTTIFLTDLGTANPFTLTIIASCCTLAGGIAAPFVIDHAGRRPTAFIGMSILFIIDAVAGGLAFRTDKKGPTLAIAILSFVFNFFWASSFFSLSNLMPSEIATPKLRNHTMAYTVACAQTTSVITTLVVPQLASADAADLGAKTYLVFAGCMAGILVFVYFFLPETRGRTFAEIDEMYEANVPMWNWRGYETSIEAKTGLDPLAMSR